MHKLSTFHTILLAAFGSLGVAGVLVFAIAVGRPSGSEVGRVEIWGALDERAFSAVIRHFAEDDGRLSQVTYVEKDPATYRSELTEALAAGTGPDIFLLEQSYALRDSEKVVTIPETSLSKSQFKDTFVEAANTFLGTGGVIALPILVDPLVLYWNKDMLAAQGFASPPTQWSAMFSFAERVTKRTDAGVLTKSAIALGEDRNVENAKAILSALIIQAGGSITGRDSTDILRPELVSRAINAERPTESALRFYTEFANPSKTSYSWSRSLPNSRIAFAAGDMALYVGFASEAPLVSRTNPNLNYGMTVLPQTKSDHVVTTARVYGLAVSRQSNNQQGAITVAFILASKEPAFLLSEALGMPASRRDVLSTSGGELDVAGRSALIARSWLDPDPERTAEMFRLMVEGVTSGALRLPDAVQRADQELSAIINP